MTAPSAWATVRALAETRLASLPSGDPRTRTLSAVLNLLVMAGAVCDERYTAANLARIAAECAAYATQSAGWRATVAPALALADRVAREPEQRQLVASTGVTLTPRLATLASGEQRPLAPEASAALSLPAGYDDEPTAPASLVLSTAGGSPVPIVRLTAKAPGREGNRLQARVDDVPGIAARFVLRVRLGGYEQAWEPLESLAPWGSNDVRSESLLLAPLTQVGLGRPATMTWTSFSGGTGLVREGVEARARAALSFPATRTTDRRLMENALRAFVSAWARKRSHPRLHAGTVTNRLADAEAQLVQAIANAEDTLVLLDALEASP